MVSLYRNYDSNVRKTWLLMSLFLALIILIGWSFSFIYNSPDILYIAIAFSLFMNFFSYWYSDKIVLAMSSAKPVNRDEHRELWNITENLSITAGLPMPKLYIINDSAPNAFATGRNKENSAVAVTTGLISILDRNELEGVIAHELAHIGNRDILLQTVVVVLVGFVTLLADFFLRMNFIKSDNNRSGQVQLALFALGLALSILAPLVATVIQLAISRKREFLADSSGALLTRYPEGLASALEKISSYSGQMKKANHATAHLFISNPFGAKARKGFNKWFMTHPPVEERVSALRGIQL